LSELGFRLADRRAVGGRHTVEIYADSVRVDGPDGPLLRETTLRARSGEVVLVAGEPGMGHSALALVLAGRLDPTSGDVLLDDALNPEGLRTAVAAVDVPGVNEPDPGLVLSHVVAEELVIAGRSGRRSAVRKWLEARDAGDYLHSEIGLLPPSARTRLLTDLAATRAGVQALVLACPDRHGGRPEFWWRTAHTFAASGYAVVVLCLDTSATLLGVEPLRLGRPELPPPPLPEPVEQPAATAPVSDIADGADAESSADVEVAEPAATAPWGQGGRKRRNNRMRRHQLAAAEAAAAESDDESHSPRRQPAGVTRGSGAA
jgi:energy-coupling factor transporter ATP-binding protein EcfA2